MPIAFQISLRYLISYRNIDINKRNKTSTYSLPVKKSLLIKAFNVIC